jgi:eukaryotic-like serine/threonine-protein kinase
MAIDELQNGRYRYLRMLGSGGMGEVYLMQDEHLRRQVAIKVLRSEESLYPDSEKAVKSADLFDREARAIAALDHPNILPLYDFGVEEREDIAMTYMVMPYCADGSLETWLRQRGDTLLSPPQVAALIEQAAEALDYAHEHKMIHLDVKPPNFLIRSNRRDPQRPTLLLADFGIARNFTTVSSSSHTIRGTPAAMSPEQWSGEPVFASDQYALAVMTYEMLAGRPPFIGSMEQLMYRHFTVPAPQISTFNPRLPAALDAVLLRALSKKPEERYPSIVEFASALTEAANQPAASSGEGETDYGTLALSQSEADAGISRMLTLVGGEEVTVSVPAGAQDGQVLRLPVPASSSEPAGVMLVNIAIKQAEKAHPSAAIRSGQNPETPLLPESARGKPRPAMPPPADPVHEARAVNQVSEAPRLQKVSLSASSSAPMVNHDLPTVAGLENASQMTAAPVPLTRPAQPRRRFGLLALVSLFVVLGVLAGSIYVFANRLSSGSGAQPTPTHVLATATPAHTPTPTVGPGMDLAGIYNGSMADNNNSQMKHISVQLIQTSGSGALSGTVTFDSSSQYPLQGHDDMQGNFIFSVQQPAGQLPLVFYGAPQQENFLHGNYCHTTQTTCPASEGYFTVGPRS